MPWLAVAALVCAAAVAAGAFGAHGLRARVDARSLEVWETAARYLMYAGLALLALGVLDRVGPRGVPAACGWSLLIGAVIFSGTLFGLALGGPRWLGAITPAGGLLMIAGFVLLGLSALRT